MYQPIGIISDGKAGGLESLLNYMNETFFSKDDPALNDYHHNVTKKQDNEDTHNIYSINETKTYNIKGHSYTGEHFYNKQQHVNNNITANISKKHSI